jgi:hypothetical protein
MNQKMNRRQFLMTAAVAAPVALGACGSMGAVDPVAGGVDSLVKGLGGSLGVSPTQALGGTGALMNVAKSTLGSDKFGSIAKLLPGMDGMLDQAAQATGGSLPTTMAGATDTFKKLGLKPEDVSRFGKYVGDSVGKSGGSKTADLLRGAWGL